MSSLRTIQKFLVLSEGIWVSRLDLYSAAVALWHLVGSWAFLVLSSAKPLQGYKNRNFSALAPKRRKTDIWSSQIQSCLRSASLPIAHISLHWRKSIWSVPLPWMVSNWMSIRKEKAGTGAVRPNPPQPHGWGWEQGGISKGNKDVSREESSCWAASKNKHLLSLIRLITATPTCFSYNVSGDRWAGVSVIAPEKQHCSHGALEWVRR